MRGRFENAQVDIGEDEPIIEIPIDPFLDTVMTTWISKQNEGRKELDATFEKYDENGDGMLSLEEFTSTHAAFLLLVPGCTSCSCRCVVMRACADPGLLPMPPRPVSVSSGARDLMTTADLCDYACRSLLLLPPADIVKEVDKGQKRFPRPRKEISKMYLEAIEESSSGDDAITQVAFLSVADHYHLGVPFVDPSRYIHYHTIPASRANSKPCTHPPSQIDATGTI